VTLEFESGLLANIVVCYSMVGSPTEHKRKDFYGTGGNFWIDLDSLTGESLVLIHEDPAHKVQPTEENLYPVKHFLREIVAVEPRSEPDYRSDRGWWQSSVESCVNHFVDCIVKGERPLVSAIDARRSLRTVLAAYESSSKGRRIELA
jgi:predicted dehydrogenase